jgi:hypothetical protein
VISVQGILPKKIEGYGIKLELVKTVNDLTKLTSEKYADLVIVFDELDGINDAEKFMRLVFSDAKSISSVGIGLVLVGLLTGIYSNYHYTVAKSLDYFYYQPFLM